MIRNAALAALAALVAGLGACSKNEDPSPSSAPPAPSTPSAPPAPSTPSAPPDKPKQVPFDELVATSTPLAPKPATQDLAGGKVSAEVCAVEGGPFVGKSHTTVLRSVRAVGDRVLVVNDEQIRAYKVEPGATCKLTIDRRFGARGALTLDTKVERLTADGAGNVWASSGIFASYKLGREGAVAAKCDARPLGYFFVHPSGRYGIGTFANADTAKVTLTGAACKTEKWAFTGLSTDVTRKGNITNAQAVGFVGDTVFLGAKLAQAADPNESNVVLALDPSGKEKFKMGKTDKSYGSKERFGWVHAIGPCKVGVCVVDSNLRRLTAWRTDGKFVGAVDLGALFGLKYPWIADFARSQGRDEDSAFFVTGQTREVKGVGEGNIYRVTGL